MAVLSFVSTLVMGGLLALAAPFIPQVYNVEPEIKYLATRCIWVVALCMPIHSYANVSYFTMRSGGKTAITFLFDSCYAWIISVPAAFLISKYTTIPVVSVFLIVSLVEIGKCIIGFTLVKSGVWVKNIVGQP